MAAPPSPKQSRRSTERRRPGVDTGIRTDAADQVGPLILTIGHSTRPWDEFLGLLRAHGVTRLIDIRIAAGSRRNPQFGRDHLPPALTAAGIAYEHVRALGGRRRPAPHSPNTAWRNLSFRGYADHMQTPEFVAAIEDLIAKARTNQLVLMCAEAVPWRCHRSLIADALLVRGVRCEDIQSTTRRLPHRITPFACVQGTHITYPPDKDAPAPSSGCR